MNVVLVAGTQILDASAFDSVLFEPHRDASDAETVIEFAGRECYGSFHRPTPATATIRGYLRNILESRHFSVLEHGTATFRFTGVSRSFTHELIRHRHLSYSELSQRFVNMENAEMIKPPAISDAEWTQEDCIWEGVEHLQNAYVHLVKTLTARGLGRKQAREAARCVMPNMAETKIVVTGNFRAWRHFLHVRGSVHADAEIRAVAREVASWLINFAPNVFQDVEVTADGVTVGHFEEDY